MSRFAAKDLTANKLRELCYGVEPAVMRSVSCDHCSGTSCASVKRMGREGCWDFRGGKEINPPARVELHELQLLSNNCIGNC